MKVQRITMLMILGAMLVLSACNTGDKMVVTASVENSSATPKAKVISDEEWLNMSITYNDKLYDLCLEWSTTSGGNEACRDDKELINGVIESIKRGIRYSPPYYGSYGGVYTTMEEKQQLIIKLIDEQAISYEHNAPIYHNSGNYAKEQASINGYTYINNVVLPALRGEK